jgi:hypothetical protein
MIRRSNFPAPSAAATERLDLASMEIASGATPDNPGGKTMGIPPTP